MFQASLLKKGITRGQHYEPITRSRYEHFQRKIVKKQLIKLKTKKSRKVEDFMNKIIVEVGSTCTKIDKFDGTKSNFVSKFIVKQHKFANRQFLRSRGLAQIQQTEKI